LARLSTYFGDTWQKQENDKGRDTNYKNAIGAIYSNLYCILMVNADWMPIRKLNIYKKILWRLKFITFYGAIKNVWLLY